ncbi:MAG: hypothetical protein NC132_01420 [Corallococcus sp.]|nr:hypothetical protein [Corallococcus sp.]
MNLKENLNTNRYSALCLCGGDRWLQRRSLEYVCQAYGVIDDGFGVDRLENASYADIEMACLTPSMFSEKKLVVVENFVFPQGKQGADTVSSLSNLVSRCDGSYCLVFESEQSAGFEKISGLEFVNCDKLDSLSVVKWIIAFGKRQGTEISNACAKKISDYCLQDMSRVASETQKLLDYGEVTLDSVELLVHKDTEYVLFDLSKHISNKNASAAIDLYKGLIASGEDARALFGLLYNFYRRVYYVKTTSAPSDRLALLLSVKPYAVQYASDIAGRYKPMQLKKILNFFDAADVKLKSFLDETETMVTLIMQIVSL